ncbi:MAG: sugar phosphate isomerase/epimerase [Acidobacteria bacterium]|nr:sugar phosphate isomerase/epimerase [Acidobacteriota bacterium]
MNNRVRRRQFLKAAGATLLAGAGSGVAATAAASGQTASGQVTAPAKKMPRIFSGCCAYTFRHLFADGSLTLESFIEKAVELRLDGVDMTVYYMKSTDPGYIENLRYLGYKNGVAFSGVACGSSMVQADRAKREQVLQEIKKWVDVTARIRAPHLRVFAGKQPAGSTMAQCVDWVVEVMKAASDYSGKKGITLGLEDHVGVSQSAEVCLEIMHRVNSPYAGINIDISHFAPEPGKDSYSQIAACMPYATHAHVRAGFDDNSPIDLDRVWKIFADAGYKGFMSYEGEEKSMAGVPAQIAEIERLCKKYSTV